MEWFGIVLVGVGGPVVFCVWVIGRLIRTAHQLTELTVRQQRLEHELARLRREIEPPSPAPSITPIPSAPLGAEAPLGRVASPTQPQWPDLSAESVSARPPPLPPMPPTCPTRPTVRPSLAERFGLAGINWEQFMGVKLLAWVGGLALFLGVVFGVKYAFEHKLLPPEVRVALGYLVGVSLIVVGSWVHRRQQYIVGAQTLCGAGVVILYASTFAARVFYQLIPTVPAFVFMVLTTGVAFVLAVRLSALVVAVLGLCGGFLTPVLLATGQDNPLGLFGYIALLDVGLVAVALRQRWHFLVPLAALGTVLLELGWVNEFFVRERYFQDNKVLIALAVFVGFSLLFGTAWLWARRLAKTDWWVTAAGLAVAGVALLFGFYLLGFAPLGQRPGVVFGYVLVIDLCVLAFAWLEQRLAAAHLAAGAVVFALLWVWTLGHLSERLLSWALALYFGFAVLHAALPVALQRVRPGTAPVWWAQLFPLAALLLMVAPILKLHPVSALVFWPVAILLDLVVIAVALISGVAWWMVAALVVTLGLAGCWIATAPAQLEMLPAELVVIGTVAVLFVAAGVWAAQTLAPKPATPTTAPQPPAHQPKPLWPCARPAPEALLAQIPALSALLPFVLLLLVTARLPLADPSPVFGLALVLTLLLLGLTWLFPVSWLPAVGLGCVLLLEHAWHAAHFKPAAAAVPLVWYVGFTLVFMAFPFLFRRRFLGEVLPWATAALAGPLHFYLVHQLVKAAWPNEYMGLLPLAFAMPCVAGLISLIRTLHPDAPNRLTLLAWFGGATLFFVTLVFPVQFQRQWITLGWALEGVALLWLFHRVPHPGLRLTGVGLLVTAFVRLALNPAVLQYHPRSATPILNWYLYTYGVTTACLFVGSRLLAPPRHLILETNAQGLLATLGTVLAFLLLNIEIADYFTQPGAQTLTFQFSGHFGRDMTYSIGWGVFALGLVAWGIGRRVRPARWAGIGLLAVTLGKLFLHDLARLAQLYRVGAFIGVAVIAIAASFLYQRFLGGQAKQDETRLPPASPPAP